VGVAQADEILEPGHDRAGQSSIDLAASVMMAINVTTDSCLSKQRQIIRARQQSYVIDLRNARQKSCMARASRYSTSFRAKAS